MAAAIAAAFTPSFALAQTGEEALPATIQAERISGRPDQEIALERNVEVTRGAVTIHADRAVYRVVEDEVEASGDIELRREGGEYTGDALRLRLGSGVGYLLNPTYRIERNNAQGKAVRVDFESKQRATITEGTYSTCEGPDPDWYLKSDTLTLDRARDVGTASKTLVYFKGVPILGTPAISFPLSDARKSGMLPPTVGTTSNGGFEITVPYYFNIAPNRDLTLYPHFISRGGLQLGATGRYLNERYSGETKVEVLPQDRRTGTSRHAISSTHTHSLAPRLGMSWNLNAASDNDYPSDFPRTITAASQRLLLRDLNFNYAETYWNASARMSNYQVLQDPAAPIARPYDRLPQVGLHAGRQDVRGFDWTVDSELTRFWHPDATMVRGERLVVNPRISYPVIRPGYFITPKLSFHLTRYALENTAPGQPDSITRGLPTLSIDSGMVFERDTQLFGQALTQTLEPHLLYVRTPYRDQRLFPNFDTSEADLNFAQLFSENRFVGHDRISEANQLTAALVSRYIEPSGAERIRAAIGQRFYFTDQRVTLGAAPSRQNSDVLIAASGRLTAGITAEASMQYDEDLRTLNRANFGARWQPGPKRVWNLQYRRDLANNLKQVDVSTQWPIADRWYGVGRINYSLPDDKVVEGLAGLEYKADCWVFRVVAQRIPTAVERATTAYFFQLELNGLTRLGSNPLDALSSSIPGYQLVNQP
jgi:LPS-assembly protein